MKKILASIALFAICFASLLGPSIFANADAVSNAPTRVINVVYDDSGSMIWDVEVKEAVDTWCQAKYSMEVFAAMLGDKDTMNVYVMSDYLEAASAGPKLTLKGSSGSDNNVAKVHNMITRDGDTPFNAVRKAYADLAATSADEKWLVILTDGAFDDASSADVDAFLAQKASNIKVMYLGMGPKAGSITPNSSKNIFFEKAATSSQILSKITEICTRVFNSNKLSVNLSTNKFDFDVPMGELVVFAQGKDVNINGIKTSDGKYINGNGKSVEVKYSEIPSNRTRYTDPTDKNYRTPKIDTNLKGTIQTFRGDYDAGTYTVDVTGAETVEIYYKPNVSIAAYLTDENGKQLGTGNALGAGQYAISFEMVRSTNPNEKIKNSKLLGDSEISAYITNGSKQNIKVKSGEMITVEEGNLTIDATATYLEYNTVSTTITYEIFRNKQLEFNILETPEYTIEGNGITGDKDPIVAKVTQEGKDISASEWAEITDFEALATGDNADVFSFTVEKTSTPGIINVYPSIDPSKANAKKYDKVDVSITATGEHNGVNWTSTDYTTVSFKDGRSKELILEVVESPTYEVTTHALKGTEKPVVVKAKYSDHEMTAEEWAGMTGVEVKQKLIGGNKNVELRVEKTSTPGIYNIYVSPKDGKIKSGIYLDVPFTQTVDGQYGLDVLHGETDGTIYFDDSRSFIEKYIVFFKWLLVFLAILAVILMYVFKPRLPKEMKRYPKIEIVYSNILTPNGESEGYVDKRHRWEPIIPETATIRYFPDDASFLEFEVKAIGKGDFVITNWDKIQETGDVVKAQGMLISKMKKMDDIICNGATKIKTREPNGDEYTCYLNKSLD